MGGKGKLNTKDPLKKNEHATRKTVKIEKNIEEKESS